MDSVIRFINHQHRDLISHYHVFREQFVLCWAGIPQQIEGKTLYSRVDIELINEQVRLFFSTLDKVEIYIESNIFRIVEYIEIKIGESLKITPLEEVVISFLNNGTYKIDQKLIFTPIPCDKQTITLLWNESKIILHKIIEGKLLTNNEKIKIQNLSSDVLICYLNGYTEVKKMLEEVRFKVKEIDPIAYNSLKATLRIIRKFKYNQ